MSDLVRRKMQVSTVSDGRCSLCGLFSRPASSPHSGRVEMRLEFGPEGKYDDTGNPLCALNRASPICTECVKAIAQWAEEPT